jgi:hypothetical protein
LVTAPFFVIGIGREEQSEWEGLWRLEIVRKLDPIYRLVFAVVDQRWWRRASAEVDEGGGGVRRELVLGVGWDIIE